MNTALHGNLLEITVTELISSRYKSGMKPASWDGRTAGIDVIRTSDGRTFKLNSDGGQSPPKPGWRIIITGGSEEEGYSWTLYAMPPP